MPAHPAQPHRPMKAIASPWPLISLLIGLLIIFGHARAEAGVAPQELVYQASERVLTALGQEDNALIQDPQRLYALVDTVLVEHMDFERMSRWVLGKHWKAASPEQQQHFAREFRGLLVRTYATALAGYRGQALEILAPRPGASADEIVVRTEIRQAGGVSTPVNFSLYQRAGEWKAYDVQIEGISLVANYRTNFAAEIRSGGLDGLIQSMAARNRQAFSLR
ncbi:MAG: phospholipid-binding protein MlaC [Gammaproteobacteria bacterium]